MSITRSGEQISPQIGKMGSITELNVRSFHLPDGQAFNIKNEGAAPIKLHVQLSGVEDGVFVETTFFLGWNPEIVKAVKKQDVSDYNLKWGY